MILEYILDDASYASRSFRFFDFFGRVEIQHRRLSAIYIMNIQPMNYKSGHR